MIRNWLRNFMIGRYGPDHLYVALFVFSIILGIVSVITQLAIFSILSYLVLFWALFRMFSRNINGRRKENDRFLRIWWPCKQRFKNRIARWKNRKMYKFFKCPACKNTLRVPKKKGKISITCPKCGERFERKT